MAIFIANIQPKRNLAMALLTTPNVDLGKQAFDFNLKGTDEKFYKLADLRGPNGLLVMFICNHCPYVKAVIDKLVRDCTELKAHGVNSVAIMSNDPSEYEEDSFSNMQKIAKEKGFSFPYLIDPTQEVAKNYGAVCTPDFFGYNKDLQLQYRGRLDGPNRQNRSWAKGAIAKHGLLDKMEGVKILSYWRKLSEVYCGP
jgi:peroxiredoxin